MQKTFKISGMHCSSCAKLIKYGLEEESGMGIVNVDFDSSKAYLDFNPNEIDAERIKNKVKNLGYHASEE